MSKRPIHEAVLKVPLRGHQHFWTEMRARQRFTVRDIDGAGNANLYTVRDYLKRLTRAGILARVDVTDTGADVFEIARDPGPEAPAVRRDGTLTTRPGLANEQMWRAMKMLGSFTHADLAIAASTDVVRVKPAAAKDYVKHLLGAGYLAVITPATPKTKAVYRLAKNTGPLAPCVCRTKWVWDQNRREVMGQETA